MFNYCNTGHYPLQFRTFFIFQNFKASGSSDKTYMPSLPKKVRLQQVLETAHLQARDGGQDQKVVLHAMRG